MQPLLIWLLCGYTWGVLTPLILWLAKRFSITRKNRLKPVLIHLFAASFFSVFSLVIFIFARQLVLGSESSTFSPLESLRNMVVAEFHSGLLIYLSILGIHHAIDYYRKYQDRELRASQLETQLAQTQLDALRSQLHPHFLFNALNSISVLMRKDVDTADRMLLHLSNLLRVTLSTNASHEIPLREELEILQRYLEIEQTRFRDRLKVTMKIDDEVSEALVPHLFFQPLVENAIRHGISNLEEGGEIEIRAERRNGMIHLQVRDNGPGIPDLRAGLSKGIGLSNTRARLEKLYGPASCLELRNAEEGGLIVRAEIPFRTEADSTDGTGR